MQVCEKCGNRGEKLVISREGLCPVCEISSNSDKGLNSMDNSSVQEFSKGSMIKDGILMLIPVVIIVILIFSFF